MDITDHGQHLGTDTGSAGVIGGGARILRELLRSPRVAKTVRIALSNLDPQAAPELVRAVIFGDTVLFFDLLSASPALANTAILGLREVMAQLLEIPVDLLDRFVPRLLRELDAEGLGEGAALAALAAERFIHRDHGALAEGLASFEGGLARGWRRGLEGRGATTDRLATATVNSALGLADHAACNLDRALTEDGVLTQAVVQLADGLRRLATNHPNLMRRLVQPLAAAGREAMEA